MSIKLIDTEAILKAISIQPLDDKLFDFLEDEQEDAISRSKLQTQSSNAQSSSSDESINQVYLLPIEPQHANKFLFNLTQKLSGEGIDRPKSILLTLRKRSPNQPNDQCKIVVQTKFNGLVRVNRTIGLVEIGTLDAADHASNTSNLVRYSLNKLISNAFGADAWWPAAGKERLLLFTAVNCDFESAMLNIKYETIQVSESLCTIRFIGEKSKSGSFSSFSFTSTLTNQFFLSVFTECTLPEESGGLCSKWTNQRMLPWTILCEFHRDRMGLLDSRTDRLQRVLLQGQMRPKLHTKFALFADLQISQDRHTVLQSGAALCD